METNPLSTSNLVACVKCGQNSNRITQLAEEMQSSLTSVREEALREIGVLREQLEYVREKLDGVCETNSLWDGS